MANKRNTSKTAYMIVTNDEVELPVAYDIIGLVGVAKYLNIPLQNVYNYRHYGHWKGKYKAVEDYSYKPKIDRYEKKRKNSIACHKYYMAHTEQIKARHKEYYEKLKKERHIVQ